MYIVCGYVCICFKIGYVTFLILQYKNHFKVRNKNASNELLLCGQIKYAQSNDKSINVYYIIVSIKTIGQLT